MSFLRSVAVLVSGTAIGHGITAAALPIVSRLYSPSDFSLLAVFSGLSSILAVAICLRFDIAVALPEDDLEAKNLLALALGSAAGIAVPLFTIALLFPHWIADLLHQPSLSTYLPLVPVSALLLGMYSTLQMWQVRQKRFSEIAKSRIIQSTSTVCMQIGAGALKAGTLGLLFGYILNAGTACIYLTYKTYRSGTLIGWKNQISPTSLKATFAKFEKFPKLSTFEAFFNTAGIQAPILLIAGASGTQDAGFILFSLSVIQAPIALFGTSIGQVFLSRAPSELRAHTLEAFTKRTIKQLLVSGGPVILCIGAIAPLAFTYVFGTQWGRSGVLVAWMTPWFLVQFITTPISMALHITGNQMTALLLQMLGLALRCGAVLIATSTSPGLAGEVYAFTGFLFYAVYLLTILRAIKGSTAHTRGE